MAERRRAVFLFSDTGGGHRSAAEAVAEAVARHAADDVEVLLVDALHSYAPTPFNRLPGLYPRMVRTPRMWGMGFRVSNGRQRGRVLTSLIWPYVRRASQRLVAEVSADLFVSFHPLLIAPTLKALGSTPPPFFAVVTDLVTGHSLWYHHRLDLCFLPTAEAEHRALVNGMKPERLRVVGLPVAERFCAPPGDRARLRAELGWPQDRPMVLVVGGGEGMGPLFETACAIARSGVDAGLAIVTGRNENLRRRLEQVAWEIPTWVYGFEQRMPQMMQAATLLVTKAGPSTIAEAANAGLPVVLYSYLPGQEEGNVEYVVSGGLGRWAPGPVQTSAAVRDLLANPEELERAAFACRQAARPRAADEVATAIIARLRDGRPGPPAGS
ncbi:MAG: monogalactosyldiacylglycerol synthase family protein [Anaerolineales bacterium]|nr:monogalactosyldiacylglycerol synthase family protein [Anaerolineales bacterium]